MYEMLYSFASKKNPLGDESLVSDEEIAEAKEYITNNMTEIFDKKTAYLRLSHLLLDNCFHELFLKDRLVLEIPTELLADPVTLQQCMRLKRLGYTIVLSGFLYEEENEEPSLSDFLEQISLYTDIDNLDQNADYVALMTMHSAKGLEFPTVFVAGMEEGIFPSSRSLDNEEDVEEERRLAYVAMTRAKQKLYLTRACERMLYGHTDRNRKSRFLKEIPKDLIEKKEQEGLSQVVSSASSAFGEVGTIRSIKADKPTVETQTFTAGDRIKHKIFGEGTILSASPMGNDTLLEIAFDTKGTKKIMANYAKVTKL